MSEQTKKSGHAQREEKILAYWKEHDIFNKTLEKESPQGEYVFYEGPPTANGKPGIHHLESRAFKDLFPRYKTMQGYRVPRKAGWDTHGLPVELKIEKDLELDSKKKIEEYGIASFNQKCRESVHEFIDVWRAFTERIGYWVDLDDSYYTYTPNYIETVWKTIGYINKRGLLYKDYKVVPWCPRCGTGLSSHELGQPEAYVDVKDLSVTAKFKLTPGQKINADEVGDNTYLLAWTTTPWTLPGNVALAVGADMEYVKIKRDDEFFILAETRLSIVEGEYKIVEKYKGSDIVGLSYEALYPYVSEKLGAESLKAEALSKAYKVYPADFVTTEDGTGIVHTAVMYGQEDFELGSAVGLPKFHLVDETGHFIAGTGELAGLPAKDREDNGLATSLVVLKYLQEKNLLFKKEKYEHSYPHCWRCKTPLIYYARNSWYIRMSSLRSELVSENQKINWEPEHIRDGRMGEWLKDAKDWAISRERYWGTPLPIWTTEDGEETLVVDSYKQLNAHAQKSGNTYFAMRHGEGDHNIARICSSDPHDPYHLTENGKEQIKKSAEILKDKKIDIVVVSPFIRTRETADIIMKELELSGDQLIVDDSIRELIWGDFHGKQFDEFLEYKNSKNPAFDEKLSGGESNQDAKKRIGDCLYRYEKEYKNKNILFVSHGIMLEVVATLVELSNKVKSKEIVDRYEPKEGECVEFKLSHLPHNEQYELDPHRPFIDEVVLISPVSGKEMRRVREVADVWMDSGAMPYAQNADQRTDIQDWLKDIAFPADFISEAIDQTRGWFYTLLAEGVLLERGTPYKNVVCLGHLLDKDGKKMSKSLGNVVDPWEQINKYGVDTLRLWMYSVTQPGDSKNYDEKTVEDLSRKVFGLLSNCYVFFETYKDGLSEEKDFVKRARASTEPLDTWIIALLHKLIRETTTALDAYDPFRPTRALKDFINDFSTWYIRRSRDRYKGDDEQDKQDALATTKYVFFELSKCMAPFAPLYAEDLYLAVTGGSALESVHLESWGIQTTVAEEVNEAMYLDTMEKVRTIVSRGLEARQKAGIKVRQPLARLSVGELGLSPEYVDLVLDEVNVKELVHDTSLPSDVVSVETTITSALRDEGIMREYVRSVQELRKIKGLTPNDRIRLFCNTNEVGKSLLKQYTEEIKKIAQADEIVFEINEGKEISIEGIVFHTAIETI